MSAAPHAHGSSEEPAKSTFVGRDRELSELRRGLDDTLAGHGRLFLLVGEPGIGKTRLASEIAADAARRGALVLWGRCDEEVGAPPFWPWAQILRRLLDASPGHQRAGRLLAHIVPELRTGPDTPDVSAQSGEQRFELFDTVERLFRSVAAQRPLLLILDDLHIADLPSLLLLRFLARQLHDAELLVLGSYRAADLDRVAERAAILNPISRTGVRLPLTPLSEAHVADLLSNALGQAAAEAVVGSVYAVTEGNPLFIAEVVQLLRAQLDVGGGLPKTAAAIQLPHGVREVIRERLRPLSGACRQLLAQASVLGRELDVSLLRVLSTATPLLQSEGLAEAERAGLIVARDPERSHFRFTHELIRSTLYDAMTVSERALEHRRVATALELAHAGRLGPHVAEIARHYVQAAILGDTSKALAYLVQAAQQATGQWAYEDADEYYTQALRVVNIASDALPLSRCEILLAQGQVRYAAGRTTARAAFEEASLLARQIVREDRTRGAQLLADAALGVAGQGLGLLQLEPDATAIGLLDEAAALLSSEQAEHGARVRARLAAHLSFPATQARSLSLIQEAEESARATRDGATLAMVLGQRHLVLWRFNILAGRLELVSELVHLAEELGDRDLAWEARAWRVVDRMTVGDGAGVDADLAVISALADARHQPRYRWMTNNFRVARALWRGQWDEAETLAAESLQLAGDLADQLAKVAAPFQLFLIGRERDQEPDEARARLIVQHFPESPMMRAVLITVLLDLGKDAEAQVELDHLALGEFAQVTRERRLGVLALLAEACWRLGDVERARALIEILQPFAAYNVMYSSNVCFGAASRYLGQLAAVGADWETAEAWFADAMARNRRMGAPALLAWTQYDCALMWERRARSSPVETGALDRAVELIAESRSLAAALQMTRLCRALDDLEHGIEQRAPRRGADSPAPRTVIQQGTFRRDGDYWSIGDGHDLVRVKDTKGLLYIATLLQQPGCDVHVLDLLDAVPDPRIAAGTMPSRRRLLAGRVTDPVLDAPARAALRLRLSELREEIDEAERFNDVGRRERLDIEAEQVKQVLEQALGLHGRSRPAGSPIERARLNVTRAIKTAVRKISSGNNTLGHYFTTTIRTGNLCRYTPHPRLPIDWNL